MSQQFTNLQQQDIEQLRGRIRLLEQDNSSLSKTVAALMTRVEESMNHQGDAFTLFQTAAKLEEAVRVRTEELETVNQRLTQELRIRKEIQQALKQAKQQAEEANLLKTKFLAAASHDLRQPLHSALLFLQAIGEDELPADNQLFLSKTKLALGSLSDLLGTLLDITKLEGGGIEPRVTDFPLAELLDPLIAEYQALAQFAQLGLRYVPSNSIVRTDRHLLQTVIRNFISNAIRYTPSGRVLVGCRRRKESVDIAVCDTGIGIRKSQLSDIFQAYYQVQGTCTPHDSGMGLGLSIVDRIADLLDLSRSVRSTPGKGSIFSVRVPLGDPAAERLASAAVPTNGLRCKTLVIIDDEPDVLTGMEAIVKTWGCHTVFANDAAAALVELINRDLVPDLVLSDYHLANHKTGSEAILEICQEFDTSISQYLMTSETDPEVLNAIRKSAIEVLPKPVNLQRLRNLLASATNSAERQS